MRSIAFQCGEQHVEEHEVTSLVSEYLVRPWDRLLSTLSVALVRV